MRNWLGGSFSGTNSSNHEWYNIDYNHSNQSYEEDNQLLWANGGFRRG